MMIGDRTGKGSVKTAAALFLIIAVWPGGLTADDRVYNVTGAFEADDQGRILSRAPMTGRIVLRANGTFLVELHVKDQGTFRFVKANPQQPRDTIYFDSESGYRYFAHPGENDLALWLHKNAGGANVWIQAEPAVESGPAGRLPGTRLTPEGLIQNGRFVQAAFYANTSAPSYLRENRATGDLYADEKGIVFRPDGSYFLRAELGSVLMKETGLYSISGDIVRIVFSDASFIDLKMINGGQALYWYTNGILISEFYFVGTANR